MLFRFQWSVVMVLALVWSSFTHAVDQRREILTLVEDFTSDLNKSLASRIRSNNLISWNYQTDINDGNLQKALKSNEKFSAWSSDKIGETKNILELVDKLDDKLREEMSSFIDELKKFVMTFPFTTNDDKLDSEITNKIAHLSDLYNKAEVVDRRQHPAKSMKCEPDLTHLFASSHDYDLLQWAWLEWRAQFGDEAKATYEQATELMNRAAQKNGFADAGDAWRSSNYRPQDDVIAMTSDLWTSVQPLYQQLHAYTRRKLIAKYPDKNIPEDGPIPAHLLGNMWAQQWSGIYDILIPYPEVESEKQNIIKEKKMSYHEMYKMAEDFFTSLGFDPMTATFWNESVLYKPKDRQVDCHGSASDFLTNDDFRILFCASKNLDSLDTIHHEMGHIQYFMSYKKQPTVYREGANSAFHEAVGDTISLSFNSEKHQQFLKFSEPEINPDISYKMRINRMMMQALNKIAFLPFSLVIDNWRWGVFNESITSQQYNEKWWKLSLDLQGIAPPVERNEMTLDPASKYHVSQFVPYIRYFLSFISQFQFHEALCNKAGHTGPLDNCDIYGSKEAGETLKRMLSLGASVEWPEAMRVITGTQSIETQAILKYFSPLQYWLKVQNEGHKIGW